MNILRSVRFPSYRRFFAAALVVGLQFATGSRLLAGASERIAISATAAPPYVRLIGADGKPRPESYVFAKDVHIGASTVDANEAKMTFPDVARMLAQNLVKQNYYPTKDEASANILLRVFWGTTTIYEDPQREFNIEKTTATLNEYKAGSDENGMADPGALIALRDQAAGTELSTEGAIARNAALLGYKRTLDKEGKRMWSSVDEQTMREELNEERYFVVVMAVDYQYFKKEHIQRILWVTRMSVRSPGNKFSEAIPALALAGAEVFGKQLDGLIKIKAPVQPGSVKLHEMQILGTVENGAPAKTEK